MQTQARRRASEVPCESNSVERKRIAEICKTFLKSEFVPCLVYGRDREQAHRGYFFCNNCDKADREQGSRPGHYINRTIVGGRYKCTAEHTNMWSPTFRHKNSQYAPEPPPAELFCQPIEEPEPIKRTKIRRAKRDKQLPAPTENVRDLDKDKTLPEIAEQAPEPASVDLVPPFPSSTNTTVEDDPPKSTNPPSNPVNMDETTVASDDTKKNDTKSSRTEPNAEPNTGIGMTPESRESVHSSPIVETVVDDEEEDDDETDLDEWLRATEMNLQEEDCPHEDNTIEDREREKLIKQVIHLKEKLTSMLSKLKDCRLQSKKKSERLRYWEKIVKETREELCEAKLAQQEKNETDKLPKSCYDPEDKTTLLTYLRKFITSKVSKMDTTSHQAASFFTDIGSLLLDKTIHGGQLFKATYNVFRKYVRENVLTPYKILRAMDLAGGPLNFRGLEYLRSVETDGVLYQQTLLPSTSCMQNCAAEVNRFGALLCPYRMLRNKETGAEGFTFRAADVMAAILVAGNLMGGEAKERSIYLSQSLDGALFTKNLGHVLGGLKFNDICNLLGQSRHSVFPILCVCQKESESLVRSLFRMMMVEIKEGAKIVLPTKFGILQLTISTNCDMSCEWKLFGRGGAAQQVTYPCSKCVVRSGELHAETQPASECKICVKLGNDERKNWICRHHKICSKEHIQQVEEDITEFIKEMPIIAKTMKSIWAKSQVIIQQDPRCVPSGMEKGSLQSVHFDLSVASLEQRRDYAKILTNDLTARGLDISGSLEDRQKGLKSSHVKEWWYHQAQRVKDQFKDSKKTTALVYMMDAIPCILHMENRMGLKLLTMILREGLEYTKSDELSWINKEAEGGMDARIQEFQDTVNRNLNTLVLGSEEFPTQWKMPYDEKAKAITTICMDNVRIRRIVNGFKILIDLCCPDESRRKTWIESVEYYAKSMKLVNNKNEMTDEEIYEYQRVADEFFSRWVDLHGERGITNYAHMIGSGHVTEYLLHWRNLSSHAQQGWEGEWIDRDRPCLFGV